MQLFNSCGDPTMISNGQRISSAFWDRGFSDRQGIFWRDSSAIAEKNNAV